jgi:hypothetical protein
VRAAGLHGDESGDRDGAEQHGFLHDDLLWLCPPQAIVRLLGGSPVVLAVSTEAAPSHDHRFLLVWCRGADAAFTLLAFYARSALLVR